MINRTRPILRLLAALTLVLVLASAPAGAGEARTAAMSGAGTAAVRGLDAAVWNPAALAFSPGKTLNLVGLAVDLQNNSFSLGRYNEVSGAELDDGDKESLLSDIPATGFRLDAGVRASGPGVQVGRLALSTGVVAAGRGNLDRDFFDLVLFGNELGQTVDFSDTWGDGHAVGKASLSWGQPVYQGSRGRMAVGVTASYLQGIYEMHVEQSYGSVTTGADAITGEAFVSAITADQGSGFGLDLGYAWQAPGGWTFGAALDNVLGSITWNGNVERHEFRVVADDVNLANDDLDNAVADSDTSFAAADYTTDLPRSFRAGAAWDRGNLLLAADWVQGFADRAGSSTTPQLNLGAEWRPLGMLTPRGGVTVGGVAGFGLAGGLGLNLGWWHVDLAMVHRGGIGGDSTRGLGFGLSSQLAF